MAGMSVSTGLISGIDYDTMITQLMQVEANPQALLKAKLSGTKADAAAYRAINTRFDALRTAAAALTANAAWNATKATSSSTTVTATSTETAVAGSVTFKVENLAATHAVFSADSWASASTVLNAANPTTITIADADGDTPATTITVPAGKTLAETAQAITDSAAGVTAIVVNTGQGGSRLQLTSKTSGADGSFTVSGGLTFSPLTTGADAKLTVGGTSGYSVTSPGNTFTDLLPGTTFTVSEAGVTATVAVKKDPEAVAAKVQSLVDAANSLLSAVSSYTDADSSTAVLKGDSTLRGLAGQVLDIVGKGVGGVSAASLGLQLTRDGQLTFDKAAFATKLASDPTAVRKMLAEKKVISSGVDGISGNADDVTSPIGIAATLEALATSASDSTTGSLTLLATSQDATAKDLQARIDDWDTRLALRKQTITRQFTAMETALGTMQNQASWLSSQIASLPSWSQSAK